jgi:hypothetical protein
VDEEKSKTEDFIQRKRQSETRKNLKDFVFELNGK